MSEPPRDVPEAAESPRLGNGAQDRATVGTGSSIALGCVVALLLLLLLAVALRAFTPIW